MTIFSSSVSLREAMFHINFAAGLIGHCHLILMNEWLGRFSPCQFL